MADETTTIVIMGASGDLTRRKLIPALYNLSRGGRLPDDFNIVGMSRTELTDDDFRDRMWKGVLDAGEPESQKDVWHDFAQNLFYCSGNLGTEEGRSGLKARLHEIEGETEVVNRLFFLSVAPQLYESAETFGLLGVLLLVERRGGGFAGRTFWTYLLLYPIARFIIEFYRGDPRGMAFGLLPTSQFVSLILVPLSAVMLVVLWRRHRAATAATAGATRGA